MRKPAEAAPRTDGSGESAADLDCVDELLEAARVLLCARAHVDAVHVIHTEIVRRTANENSLPAKYSSYDEAYASHDKLRAAYQRVGTAPAVSRLVAGWQAKPAWVRRSAVTILLGALSLRYAWAVSDKANWPRQHPEGNWLSRYYDNDHFGGFPLVRYDAGVDYDFSSGAPALEMSMDFFSARWDTCLVVTKDVVVPLQLASDDSSKLFLDDQLQFEVDPGPGEKSAELVLHPGLRHLRVDFIERTGMALVRLSGFEGDGTEAYGFRRPVIEGEEVRCR